jgi:predicted nucleic acid-binding protein
MQVLVDTNVLLRLVEQDHPQCQAATEATKILRLAGHQLVIVPQVIYEFWVVATRPIEANGLALNGERALAELNDLSPTFKLLRDERSIYEVWQALVVDHGVVGKHAHDTRIVAAMIRHGVSLLLTFNSGDFSRYPSITTVDPKNAESYTSAN